MLNKLKSLIHKFIPQDHVIYHEFESNEIFYKHKLLENATFEKVIVDLGKVYYVNQHDMDVIALDEGEYFLSDLEIQGFNPSKPATIYMFNTQEITRHWSSRFLINKIQNIRLQISGSVSLKIANLRSFYHYLKMNDMIENTKSIDHALIQQISTIIQLESIPKEDIELRTQDFEKFLNDTLHLFYEKQGLTLLNFSIHQESDQVNDEQQPSQKENSFAPKLTSIFHSQKAQNEEAASTESAVNHDVKINKEEKIYFRVLNGEQIGPFSFNEIQSEIDLGKIHANQLLWKQGNPTWEKGFIFKEFKWHDQI